jgi:hypothetical protein
VRGMNTITQRRQDAMQIGILAALDFLPSLP